MSLNFAREKHTLHNIELRNRFIFSSKEAKQLEIVWRNINKLNAKMPSSQITSNDILVTITSGGGDEVVVHPSPPVEDEIELKPEKVSSSSPAQPAKKKVRAAHFQLF